MNESRRAPAISVCKLAKRYESGRVVALDGIDLDIGAGEWVSICGPSGCGKSTLLNLLAAIDSPDAGTLNVCGTNVEQLRGPAADTYRRDTVGLVFQLHNLLPRLTAIENVQIPLLPTAIAAVERASRAAELLRRVGLEHRSHALPPTLSGGERQRVAICRALINRPRVLLADEPTGALDSASGQQLLELFAALQTEFGMTLVVVTHDHGVAQRADRVIHMLDGRIARPNS